MTEESPRYRVDVAPRLVPADPCPHCAERAQAAEIARLRVQLAETEAYLADVLGDVARLRAGLEGLRREHVSLESDACQAHPDSDHYTEDEDEDGPYCTCGATEQNRVIDALLTSTGPPAR